MRHLPEASPGLRLRSGSSNPASQPAACRGHGGWAGLAGVRASRARSARRRYQPRPPWPVYDGSRWRPIQATNRSSAGRWPGQPVAATATTPPQNGRRGLRRPAATTATTAAAAAKTPIRVQIAEAGRGQVEIRLGGATAVLPMMYTAVSSSGPEPKQRPASRMPGEFAWKAAATGKSSRQWCVGVA